MNLCVNSRGGTCYLSSKDSSKDSHIGEYIFKYIDNFIEEVEALKVVQVVTDNATNNVVAVKFLKVKRPNIFWSGCAAHTMDLMLGGISKLPGIAKLIDQAKSLTISHHRTLAMMRAHTHKRDIVRPGETSHGHRILVKYDTCLESVQSFGEGSKLADAEIPSLGFIYGEILEAKNLIKEATEHVERNYKPIIKIIDEKMKGMTLLKNGFVDRHEELDDDGHFGINTQASRVRALYDDDFVSDGEDDGDMEFEDDEDPLFHDTPFAYMVMSLKALSGLVLV
ncbi:unnamed protein product [Microthlaspi erraticum]|uniref:DUF659 domain-containing protein n=1 Tax=Microthlaspi erraticum TaxID=1685480 RepID=A0A6D2HXZ9_9BRAS|nr:unnamed protein product [Microthlaspi erraticum]